MCQTMKKGYSIFIQPINLAGDRQTREKIIQSLTQKKKGKDYSTF